MHDQALNNFNKLRLPYQKMIFTQEVRVSTGDNDDSEDDDSVSGSEGSSSRVGLTGRAGSPTFQM